MTSLEEIIKKGEEYNLHFNEPKLELRKKIYENILKELEHDDIIIWGKSAFEIYMNDVNDISTYFLNKSIPLDILVKNPEDFLKEMVDKFKEKYNYVSARETIYKKLYLLEVEFLPLLSVTSLPENYKLEKTKKGKIYINTNFWINLEPIYFENITPSSNYEKWKDNIEYEQWFYKNMFTISESNDAIIKSGIKVKIDKTKYYQYTGFNQINKLITGNDNDINCIITNEKLEEFEKFNIKKLNTPYYFNDIDIYYENDLIRGIIVKNNYQISQINEEENYTNFHGLLLFLMILHNILSENDFNINSIYLENLMKKIVLKRIEYLKINNRSGLENNLWNVFTIQVNSKKPAFYQFKEREWNSEGGFYYR